MYLNSKFASSSLLALTLALAACQESDEVGASGELGARLAAPTTLEVVHPSSAEVSGRDQAGASVEVGPLSVEGGSITAKLDGEGNLVIQDFQVVLADVLADDGTLAGAPRTLTDVRLSLGRQLVLRDAWDATGGSASASVVGDVRLDWAIVDADGTSLPLGTLTVSDVQIDVDLRAEDDGSISARLSASLYGRVFGNWGVELTDFAMEVSATSDGK